MMASWPRGLRGITFGTAVVFVSAMAAAGGGPAAQLGLSGAKITSGPTGEVPSREATFTFTGGERVPLAASACRLDGGPWVRCTSPVTYRDLVGGSHRFEVRLDGALVDRTPDVRDWVVAVNTESTDPCSGPGGCANPAHFDNRPVRPRRPRRRDVSGCAYGGNRLVDGTRGGRRYAAATACLISVSRARHGIPRPSASPRLALAARRQVRDMIERRYFAHLSPDGRSAADRIARTGFLRDARFWAIGEVLAYGTDRLTPGQLVRAWMRSSPHRKVILTAALRRIGVAVSRGTPRSRRRGVTAAAELGRRG